YARILPLAKSASVRPIRDGLKSFGPKIAHDVATTTSCPSTTAFKHSCSTPALDFSYGIALSKGLNGTVSSDGASWRWPTAENEPVTTTRPAPASRAARRRLRVPMTLHSNSSCSPPSTVDSLAAQ